MRNRGIHRGALIALLILGIIGGGVPVSVAGPGDVEQRIADFWKRVDALQPTDYLSAADLGQWALNVIERNPRARTTIADFRTSTGAMQAGMDRAGLAPESATPVAPVAGVEQRIADYWKRVDALLPSDFLSAADLGQWALNVIDRNPRARITVADFRTSTGLMQAGMDRAGLAPAATPAPVPPSTSLTYIFDAGVSDQDKADIRDGAALGSAFGTNAIGNDPARNITVSVHKGNSPYGSCCFASSSTQIDIYVDHIVWNSSYVAPGLVGVERRKVLVHEYVHTLQYARRCVGSPKVPVWLYEGMAEYSGFAAVIGAGLISSAQVRAYEIGGLRQTPSTTTLQSSEAKAADWPVSLSYMAVDQLLIEKSMSTLGVFCDAVAIGRDWHDAFVIAFGFSVADFYVRFEAYRRNPT